MIVIDFGHFSSAEIKTVFGDSSSLATVRVIDIVGHTGESHVCPWRADHNVGEPERSKEQKSAKNREVFAANTSEGHR